MKNEQSKRKEIEEERKADRNKIETLEEEIATLNKGLDSTRFNQADAETTVVERKWQVGELEKQIKEKETENKELKKRIEQMQDVSSCGWGHHSMRCGLELEIAK